MWIGSSPKLNAMQKKARYIVVTNRSRVPLGDVRFTTSDHLGLLRGTLII